MNLGSRRANARVKGFRIINERRRLKKERERQTAVAAAAAPTVPMTPTTKAKPYRRLAMLAALKCAAGRRSRLLWLP